MDSLCAGAVGFLEGYFLSYLVTHLFAALPESVRSVRKSHTLHKYLMIFTIQLSRLVYEQWGAVCNVGKQMRIGEKPSCLVAHILGKLCGTVYSMTNGAGNLVQVVLITKCAGLVPS